MVATNDITHVFTQYGLAGGTVVSIVSSFYFLLRYFVRLNSNIITQHRQEREEWQRHTLAALSDMTTTLASVRDAMAEHCRTANSFRTQMTEHASECTEKLTALMERTRLITNPHQPEPPNHK